MTHPERTVNATAGGLKTGHEGKDNFLASMVGYDNLLACALTVHGLYFPFEEWGWRKECRFDSLMERIFFWNPFLIGVLR